MDNNIIIDIIMCGYTQSVLVGGNTWQRTYYIIYIIYVYDYTLYTVIEKYYII